MKFITKNCNTILLAFFLLVIVYFIYYYITQILLNKCGFKGFYVRISGDTNQPKYLENIKTANGQKYIYYDDNKQIINTGNAVRSYFSNSCTVYHDKQVSFSKCKKMLYDSKNSLSICNGSAKEKYGKNNISYTSVHRYFNINNTIYYENTYYYSDGDISTAIYKKIKK